MNSFIFEYLIIISNILIMNQIKSFFIFYILFSSSFIVAQDSVLVKDASFRYEYTEFELEKTTVSYLVKSAYSGYYDLSNSYETVTEQVQIKPPRIQYRITEPIYKTVIITKKSKGKTTSYEKQILIKKATIKRVEIPGEYATITKKVICCPDAGIKSDKLISVPAEYNTYEAWTFKQKTIVERIEISAEYKILD